MPPPANFRSGDLAIPGALLDAIRNLPGSARGSHLARISADLSQNYRARGVSRARVTSPEAALAYALTRMPATFAALERALDALRRAAPDFAPRSLLDLGCGPGTASWAAADAFPSIETAALIDSNRYFLDAARTLAAGHPLLRSAAFIIADMSAPPADADLVVASYTLTEIADPRAAVARIWPKVAGALLVVEPGTPRDYERLMHVREALIAAGGTIAAPCPHHAPCPLAAPDWCHFSVRLPRTRDHMRLKGGTLGYEDEKFSYLVATRPQVALSSRRARVLARPAETKFDVTLKLCEDDGRATYRSVTKRDADYRMARKLDWGDSV